MYLTLIPSVWNRSNGRFAGRTLELKVQWERGKRLIESKSSAHGVSVTISSNGTYNSNDRPPHQWPLICFNNNKKLTERENKLWIGKLNVQQQSRVTLSRVKTMTRKKKEGEFLRSNVADVCALILFLSLSLSILFCCWTNGTRREEWSQDPSRDLTVEWDSNNNNNSSNNNNTNGKGGEIEFNNNWLLN